MEQIISQFLQLKDRQEIEFMAGKLSFDEALELLKHITKSPQQYEEKIQPLLAGLRDFHYSVLLPTSILKPFARKEILQHKISLLISQMKEIYLENQELLKNLIDRISAFSLIPIQPDALKALQVDIQNAFEKNAYQLDLLNPMSEIAWLSERTDLVLELSELKSALIHLSYYLGLLPELLLKRLSEVLGSLDEASNMEALAALGITYPEDFDPLFTALNIPPDMKHLENELIKKDLASVKDFKKHHLFTKELLLAYLDKVH